MPRPRTFDEADILDRAADTFRRHGFEGTSMADLEAATGLGRQSLYNAFGGKQALYAKALERYRSQAAERFDGVVERGYAGIRVFLGQIVDGLLDDPERRGCLLTRAQVDSATADAPPSACVRNEASLQRFFVARLKEAEAAGELRRGVDPVAAAGLFVTLAHGLSAAVAGGASRASLEAQSELLLASLGGAMA